MKRILFLMLCLPLLVQAQQIQFASKVLKYSSDLGGKQNGVKRILGKPDAFPQGGPSANAWVAKDALGHAYIEVEFAQAQLLKQVAIFENLNAGCVSKVLVADASGKLHTVARKKRELAYLTYGWQQKKNADRAYYFSKKRRKIETAPDVEYNADIEYFILETPEPGIKIVRVEFNFGLKPGQKQIDAIAISDMENPILPAVNLIAGAAALPNPEQLVHVTEKNGDLSSILVMENKLYYTISVDEQAGEIHAIDLEKPTTIVAVDQKIRNDKKLNYLLGYAAVTQSILVGSENKYRRGSDDLGFDFFNLKAGVFSYQKPLKVLAYNNYGDYADAALAHDGKRVLFGIESDLTLGGYDIYFAEAKDEIQYGMLQNFGKTLNTAADETNPFLLSDDKTLIFTSNGYSGYGDFDLYVSMRLDDSWKNWSEPKNLGPKVNGQSFDTSPFYDEKTETLYYVSFRDGASTIQKIKIPMATLTGSPQ